MARPIVVSVVMLSGLLTGCGMNGGGKTAGSGGGLSGTVPAAKFVTGKVHGGQQAVTGSTVELWAAGVSGTGAANYGANATLIASTTTDSNGFFGFDNASGVSPCTTGQYLYVTAQGGNAGGGTNSALAMMAALPTPCDATTGSQYVSMNELTTVAAVWALQQFMTISPGGAMPWQIGAPSTNVAGLANAFGMSNYLATTSTGAVVQTTSVSNTISTTTYTTTVNSDYARVNLLADILAACVNTADAQGGGISAMCTSLFADTTPGTATAPTDTIQAAWYLATNAAGLTMNKGSYTTSPQYLCSTYVTAQPPFQPTTPCTSTNFPYDWALGISYTAGSTNTKSTANSGTIVVDAQGNLWTSQFTGSATGGYVTKMSALGKVLLKPVSSTTILKTAGWYGTAYTGTTTYTLGGSRLNALAIDTTGSVWSAHYYPITGVTNTGNTTAGSGGTYQTPLVHIDGSTGASTGYLVGSEPSAVAIDGNNNVYVTSNTGVNATQTTAKNYMSELVASGGYTTFYTGVGNSTALYNQIVIDGSADQLATPFSNSCGTSGGTLYRANTTVESAQGVNATTFSDSYAIGTTSTGPPITCAAYGAVDAHGNLWAAYNNAAGVEYIDVTSSSSAPVVTQYASGDGSTYGGLNVPHGLAIDGAGNVWISNNSTSGGGVTELQPGANGTTVTALSPAATGVTGFAAQNAYPSMAGVTIDPSGNLWLPSSAATSVYALIGMAAPVVTPTSVAVKNSAIAQRP